MKDEFLSDLTSMDALEVVRKHITSGPPAALSHKQYYELKKLISDHFGIHPSAVIVVGSARLGFSIKPTAYLREFYEESDIDVAIVDSSLFDRFWQIVYDFHKSDIAWGSSSFRKYVFSGWIRPDMFPPAGRVQIVDGWNRFFTELNGSQRFDYSVSGGLYKNWHFLESYHKRRIVAIQSGFTEGQSDADE